eukprot:scaffold6.g2631.t1
MQCPSEAFARVATSTHGVSALSPTQPPPPATAAGDGGPLATAAGDGGPLPAAFSNIVEAAVAVLNEPDPHGKAALTQQIVRLVEAWEVSKRGKGGSLASRQSMLHSLVHIENVAVDLAWDIIARFGGEASYRLPRAFFEDFVKVAADECRHFLLLEQRLIETGSFYGALPAHDGLWQSAIETAGSLGARLAVEHCCHEARGLDVLPQTVARFRALALQGTSPSEHLPWASLPQVIYAEEISHCAAGVRWLTHLYQLACSEDAWPSSRERPPPAQLAAGLEGGTAGGAGADAGGALPAWAAEARQHAIVESWFHTLIRRHFHGLLKPPFNNGARAKAGLLPEWYLPLAVEGEAAAGRT